jgi:hypothetical protein
VQELALYLRSTAEVGLEVRWLVGRPNYSRISNRPLQTVRDLSYLYQGTARVWSRTRIEYQEVTRQRGTAMVCLRQPADGERPCFLRVVVARTVTGTVW